MSEHDRTVTAAPSSAEDRGELSGETRCLGLTALDLSKTVTAVEYANLYLISLGYEIDDAATLQELAPGEVTRIRRRAKHKLLAVGNQSGIVAAARAIEIGFLPDPAEEEDEGVPDEGTAHDNLKFFQLICQGATNNEVQAALGKTRTAVEKMARNLLLELNACNRDQLPRRGYQAKLVRPAVPAMPMPAEYADMLEMLADRNSGPLVSMPREDVPSDGGSPAYQKIGDERPTLNTTHLKLEEELTPQVEAALPPPLRTAVGVAHPRLRQHTFGDKEAAYKALSATSGQTRDELPIHLAALYVCDWLELSRGSNGEGIRIKLSRHGERLMRRGLKLTQAEVEAPLPKPQPKETSD